MLDWIVVSGFDIRKNKVKVKEYTDINELINLKGPLNFVPNICI